MIDNSHFDKSVQDLVGTKLSKPELAKLHEKYSLPGTDQLDRSRFLKDLKGHLETLRENQWVTKPNIRYVDGESFECCMSTINGCIVSRLNQTQPNMDQALLKRAFQLLGASKTPRLSRNQLKQLCLNRLHLCLTERDLDRIFSQLDPAGTGSVKSRELLQTAIGVTESANLIANRNLPFESNSDRTKLTKTAVSDNLSATMSYNHKFSLLAPPKSCQPMSIAEMEQQIGDRIFSKSGLGTNFIQAFLKCFGDSRLKGERNAGISLDQMKYSLWKRLQLNVSVDDIAALFRKYDINNTGYVPLKAFVQGIVKQHSLNEPLLIDPKISSGFTLTSGSYSSSSLPAFMNFLRGKIQERINIESRAPHYLLHGTTRMTLEQAKIFFDKKLAVDVSDQLLQELLEHYPSSGLIDLKRVLRDAMTVSSIGINGEDLKLVDGGMVAVERMPASLRGLDRSPEDIAELLHSKMFQRSKDNHPLSNMYKMFQEDGVITRACGQPGLRRVLQNFDIILAEPEFQRFFAAHDRGDGKIDVRSLLVKLMHNQQMGEINGLVSKDPEQLRREVLMTKSMGNITGIQRVVSTLQGPSYTGFNVDVAIDSIEFNQKLAKRPSSATQGFGNSVSQLQRIFGSEEKVPVGLEMQMHNGTKTDTIVGKTMGKDAAIVGIQTADMGNQSGSEAVNSFAQSIGAAIEAPSKPPIFSPMRPKSAPPSRSRLSGRMDASSMPFDGTSSGPRPTTSMGRPTKSTFVHTGQSRGKEVDPHSPRLVLRYDIAKKHVTKSTDDYGLFVKSYSKFANDRLSLEKKLRGR